MRNKEMIEILEKIGVNPYSEKVIKELKKRQKNDETASMFMVLFVVVVLSLIVGSRILG
jgi:hypothetical protein